MFKNPESIKANTASAPFKRSSLSTSTALLIATFLMAGAGLGLSIWNYKDVHTPLTPLASSDTGNQAKFTDGSIAKVASVVAPSVVSILTETRTSSWLGQESTSSSAGTGIIVSKDGYIVTNKHVIKGADKIKAVLSDGTSYQNLSVVATDALNDIAFLKIKDARDLKPAKLGDSKTIHVGQQVIAVGNALGQFQSSVTSGVISGIGRSISASSGQSTETLSDMIQTDASINPGNSGGPLVNAAGQVVGINTAVSANAQGIGFAIPVANIKGMLKSLLKTGRARRSYLGVYYLPLTPEIAKTAKLPVKAGAYIYSENPRLKVIAENSPASHAGLKEKDLITAVNGVPIGAAGSLSTLLSEYAAGDTVELKVLRGDKELHFKVTLSEYKIKP